MRRAGRCSGSTCGGSHQSAGSAGQVLRMARSVSSASAAAAFRTVAIAVVGEAPSRRSHRSAHRRSPLTTQALLWKYLAVSFRVSASGTPAIRPPSLAAAARSRRRNSAIRSRALNPSSHQPCRAGPFLQQRGRVQKLAVLADRRPVVLDRAVVAHEVRQPVAEQLGRAAVHAPGRQGVDRGDDRGREAVVHVLRRSVPRRTSDDRRERWRRCGPARS